MLITLTKRDPLCRRAAKKRTKSCYLNSGDLCPRHPSKLKHRYLRLSTSRQDVFLYEWKEDVSANSGIGSAWMVKPSKEAGGDSNSFRYRIPSSYYSTKTIGFTYIASRQSSFIQMTNSMRLSRNFGSANREKRGE